MMSGLSVGSGLSLEPGSENIIWQTFKMLLLVSRLGFRLESGVGRGKLSGNVLTHRVFTWTNVFPGRCRAILPLRIKWCKVCFSLSARLKNVCDAESFTAMTVFNVWSCMLGVSDWNRDHQYELGGSVAAEWWVDVCLHFNFYLSV